MTTAKACVGQHIGPPTPRRSGSGVYCGGCGWGYETTCEPEPVELPLAPAIVRSLGDLRAVLAGIVLAPSGVTLAGWRWEIGDAYVAGLRGWAIRASFLRPDRETGEVDRGAGRWEHIAHGATETAVVKTAWLLYELVIRHESMEAFTYRGVRIFDPHHTVAELSMSHLARGGR